MQPSRFRLAQLVPCCCISLLLPMVGAWIPTVPINQRRLSRVVVCSSPEPVAKTPIASLNETVDALSNELAKAVSGAKPSADKAPTPPSRDIPQRPKIQAKSSSPRPATGSIHSTSSSTTSSAGGNDKSSGALPDLNLPNPFKQDSAPQPGPSRPSSRPPRASTAKPPRPFDPERFKEEIATATGGALAGYLGGLYVQVSASSSDEQGLTSTSGAIALGLASFLIARTDNFVSVVFRKTFGGVTLGVYNGVTGGISRTFRNTIGSIQSNIQQRVDYVKSTPTRIVNGFKAGVQAQVENVKALPGRTAQALGTKAQQTGQSIAAIPGNTVSAIQASIRGFTDKVTRFPGETADAVNDRVSSTLDAVTGSSKDLLPQAPPPPIAPPPTKVVPPKSLTSAPPVPALKFPTANLPSKSAAKDPNPRPSPPKPASQESDLSSLFSRPPRPRRTPTAPTPKPASTPSPSPSKQKSTAAPKPSGNPLSFFASSPSPKRNIVSSKPSPPSTPASPPAAPKKLLDAANTSSSSSSGQKSTAASKSNGNPLNIFASSPSPKKNVASSKPSPPPTPPPPPASPRKLLYAAAPPKRSGVAPAMLKTGAKPNPLSDPATALDQAANAPKAIIESSPAKALSVIPVPKPQAPSSNRAARGNPNARLSNTGSGGASFSFFGGNDKQPTATSSSTKSAPNPATPAKKPEIKRSAGNNRGSTAKPAGGGPFGGIFGNGGGQGKTSVGKTTANAAGTRARVTPKASAVKADKSKAQGTTSPSSSKGGLFAGLFSQPSGGNRENIGTTAKAAPRGQTKLPSRLTEKDVARLQKEVRAEQRRK